MKKDKMMKAAVYTQYGSPAVLRIVDVPVPTPREEEVLIKIHAASVNAYDWHLLRAKPFFSRFTSGLFVPRNQILGADIAGVVEEVGEAVTKWKVGDAVYGCLESCGKGGLASGGFAQYVCAKESVIARKSQEISYEESAALPMAAVTALQGLRDYGKLKPEQSVLVNGASGGVGSYAIQIAKAMGAIVTGVCSMTSMDLIFSLGADECIDYEKEDFSRNGKEYDVILDVAATHSVKDYRRSLKPGGICVVAGFSSLGHAMSVGFAGEKKGKAIKQLMADNASSSDLIVLNEMIEKGQLRSAIAKSYPLFKAAEAIDFVERKHPMGKVVISMIKDCQVK